MSYHNQRLIIQKSSHNSFTVEIDIRFGHASILVYNRFVIILSKMVTLVYKNVNWKEKFNLFAVLFKDGSACTKALEVELELQETFWLESKDCLPANISSALKRIPFNGFNNVKVCFRILGCSPVTTCTSERSISAMRRVQTYARSIMVSERLNGIALIHFHQKIVLLKPEDLILPKTLSVKMLT